jgi:Tfp pilus assembly protein PilX
MITKKTEKGQALILIVLAIVGMIGLTAAAVDGGMAYSERRQAQNTADASALDAALAKIRGGDWHAEGIVRAASNGFDNNGSTNTVQVNNPPVAGCDGINSTYAGNSQYVQVIIHNSTQTYFGPVIGINEVNNCVEAIARAKPATTQPMVFGNAIVALKPNGTKTFWMHGNPSMTTIGGGVFVNSSTDCGFTSNGVPDLVTPNITMVAGSSCPTMAGVGITYNAPQITYPPNNLPNPVCSGNAVKTGNTLSPGTVNGSFPPGGVTVLNPGVYCVNGSFTMNGNDTLTGSEVVIVMNSGNIRWNGNGSLNLSAPTSGPFKGLLIYFPMSNSSEIRINGTSDQSWTGTILAPASPIVMLGTADSDAYHSQIIGYTVEIGGTYDGIIRYNDSENYDAMEPPQLELTR